jgi:hypothetical protein
MRHAGDFSNLIKGHSIEGGFFLLGTVHQLANESGDEGLEDWKKE